VVNFRVFVCRTARSFYLKQKANIDTKSRLFQSRCTTSVTSAHENLTTWCPSAPEISQQLRGINDRRNNLATNPPHHCRLLSPDPVECDHHGSSYEHQHHASTTQHNTTGQPTDRQIQQQLTLVMQLSVSILNH